MSWVSVRAVCGVVVLASLLPMCGGSSDTGNDNPPPANAGGEEPTGTAGKTSGGTSSSQGGDNAAGEVSTDCDPGKADCDDKPGCEADLNSAKTCGACDNACEFDNASGTCKSGKCTIGSCTDGFDDCDGDAANGCETSLSDAKNCGECGKRCSGSETCEGGKCSAIDCPAGKANCDSNAANGCETPLNTLTDCNMCGRACELENATASCDTGTCDIDKCDTGWGDCDKDARSGCEAPLNTVGNCGTCGEPCAFDNADASCETGTCTFTACQAGYADCDKDPAANGCETPINTASNCGACGAPCTLPHSKTTCDPDGSNFKCNFAACDSGWVDVNQKTSDGCECNDLPLDAGTSCQAAKSLDALNPGTTFQVVGTVPVPTDSDWYAISIPLDRSRDFSIGLVAASTGASYRIEVKKNCALGDYKCPVYPDTGSNSLSADITSFTFSNNCGGACPQEAQRTNNLADADVPTVAYVRVYRIDQALSCEQYTLEVSRP